MFYDERKQFYRKSWEGEYNYLSIEISKRRDQRRYCICNESKNTYFEYTWKTKPFQR